MMKNDENLLQYVIFVVVTDIWPRPIYTPSYHYPDGYRNGVYPAWDKLYPGLIWASVSLAWYLNDILK